MFPSKEPFPLQSESLSFAPYDGQSSIGPGEKSVCHKNHRTAHPQPFKGNIWNIWNIWISGISWISLIFLDFFDFYGVPEVREAFRKLPGAGALHPDQIWAHIKPYGPHSSWFFKIFLIFDATPSMTFSNSDAKVASTRPGTHLKRRGSKFRFGWWSGHLHSSHMDPIGEKTVPHMVNSGRCVWP